MQHDFHSTHGGANNPCDGQGFMSYGNHLSQWSQCSVQDFTAQYAANANQWCMPGMNSSSLWKDEVFFYKNVKIQSF